MLEATKLDQFRSLAARSARGAALALLLASPVVAQEIPDTWYAERIISGDTPPVVEHLWSKGSKLRAETVIGGQPILTLVNTLCGHQDNMADTRRFYPVNKRQ